MKKSIFFLFLFSFLYCSVFSQTYRRAIDFSGKRVGLNKSSVLSGVVKKRLDGKPVLYSTMNDAIIDLRAGKIDGFIVDLSVAIAFAEDRGNTDLRVIEIPDSTFISTIGACSADKIIIDRFNIFLVKIETDGTLKEMQSRWFNSKEDVVHPDIKSSGLKGVMKVATSSRSKPFAFKEKDTFKGFSVELVKRFASSIEYSIIFEDLMFHEMIPAVKEKKVDLAISNISITPERQKIVIFSEPYYTEKAGMIIRK